MEQSSDKCPVTVLQKVEVTGSVTITPEIECGPLTVTCLEGRVDRDDFGSCGQTGRTKCRLVLVQEICVEVPVTFSAGAHCEVEEAHCGQAVVVADECSEDGSDTFDQSCDGSESPSGSADDRSPSDSSSSDSRSESYGDRSDSYSSSDSSSDRSDSYSSSDSSSDGSGESGSAWDR